MSIPSPEEINTIAKEFIRLRDKAKKSKSKRVKQKFNKYQNFATTRLAHLVMMKANKYKKFSNYPDLMQDGFEALILALKTFKPNKGDFTWWARKYIDTRISRAANTHSTIRFPLKKAKETQPYKTSTIPVLIDIHETPIENSENGEIKNFIMTAIGELPDDQKNVVLKVYEFNGGRSNSISAVSKELKISRPTCVKLLDAAKESLKLKLSTIQNEI